MMRREMPGSLNCFDVLRGGKRRIIAAIELRRSYKSHPRIFPRYGKIVATSKGIPDSLRVRRKSL